MESKFIFSIGVGLVCTFLLSTPATAERSLLEDWVFAHYGGVSIERFRTAADGAPMPRGDPEMNEAPESWIVIDKVNCIIRAGNSSHATTEYYLNNISANRPTIYKSDDTFHIGLMGHEPIRCRIENSDKHCDRFFTLRVAGADRYRAVTETINRIYANFCRHAH